MALRDEVLRNLVTEYQKEKDPIIFERILKRTDNLLFMAIYTWIRMRPHLGAIDLRDLYHSSIVGLGRALATAKPKESGGQIAARIISYVRNEINVDYPFRKRRRRCLILPEKRTTLSLSYNPMRELNHRLELEEIMETCGDFLTNEGVDVLVEKFVNGKNAYEIARERKCSPQSVDQKIKYWLRRIGKEMGNGSFNR